MEVWVEDDIIREGVDRSIIIVDDCIINNGKQIGMRVRIDSEEGQSRARSMAGSIEWILLEFQDWTMIPIENIIASCDGGPTKVAARITSPEQAQGAAFALDIGVDAILAKAECLDSALIAKFQRQESCDSTKAIAREPFTATILTVIDVKEGGVGDRVCVDFTSYLEKGEGMLVGSSASSMVLVHSETIESEFVPVRPFRVNAGAVHCYTLMANGTTKYLCEIISGDEVAIISTRGNVRAAVVGRLKIERRPLIQLLWSDGNGKEAHTFLQQAETVRLIEKPNTPTPITEVEIGAELIGSSNSSGRHLGLAISAEVHEV
jgi:3-dehydroquinate synthase II